MGRGATLPAWCVVPPPEGLVCHSPHLQPFSLPREWGLGLRFQTADGLGSCDQPYPGAIRRPPPPESPDRTEEAPVTQEVTRVPGALCRDLGADGV